MEKIAVITGTSSGIGTNLAEKLAREGWNLVLLNRSVTKTKPLLDHLQSSYPNRQIQVIETDLSDQEAVKDAAAQITARYRRIDALFNNAGVLLGELTYSKQNNEMHFEVNTLAPYLLMRLLQDSLAAAASETGQSVIVNVSSGALFMTGKLRVVQLRRPARLKKLTGAYGQSKLALTTLTNTLAPEYQKRGSYCEASIPAS